MMTLVAAAMVTTAAVPAFGGIPLPDAVVHSELIIDGAVVQATDQVSVIARFVGKDVARYEMGGSAQAGNNFVLRIRVESLIDGADPSDHAIRLGDTVDIYVIRHQVCVGGSNANVVCEENDECPGGTCGSIESFLTSTTITTTGVQECLFCCTDASDCGDANDDGVTDDSCQWYGCGNGVGATQATCTVVDKVAPSDLGGAFGACSPDNFVNIHDRTHALTCFAGVNSCDALNIDAGGPFGSCVADGYCNIHDATHSMNAFAGVNPCACPLGPAPEIPPSVAGQTTLRLVPTTTRVRPGGKFDVDVYMSATASGLKGYQLELSTTGGRSGQPVITGMRIADHKDAVFGSRVDTYEAFNLETAQLLAGVDGLISAPVKNEAYLATVTFKVPKDAVGTFVIDVAAGLDAQTFILGPADTKVDLSSTVPAVVTVTAVR
jgi:hypothetical protein